MTQFPAPDAGYPPQAMPPGVSYEGPKPFSKAAVTGFIFSLLFCIPGVHVLLGLLFGIIGLGATKGGRMRGRGLAIAAIPLSLVVGALSTIMAIFFGMMMMAGMEMVPALVGPKLMPVFVAASGDTASAVATLRTLSTDTFNARHSDAELKEWLGTIATEYGAMVNLTQSPNSPPPTPGSDLVPMSYSIKFVNKTSQLNIRWRMTMQGIEVKFKIENIDVGGVAPGAAADPGE